MIRVLVAAFVLTGALAGCTNGPAEPLEFDGENAFGFVAGLIMADDGAPRYRVPGTADHAAAGVWLADAMRVEGWELTQQNFTGEDYLNLDQGSVSRYTTVSSVCSREEQERLRGLNFTNYVARFPGTGGERTMGLGAHWESKATASQDPDPANRDRPVLGANDGASGVGVLLQLMREVSWQNVKLDYDLVVVFFDGEDGFEDCHPLAGSVYYVATRGAGAIDRFLLLDMVGDLEARFIRETSSVASDPALVDLLWKYGQTWAPERFTDIKRPVTDDHTPFIDVGIPAVDIIDMGRIEHPRFPPYWHTTEDNLSNIDAAALGVVGKVVLNALVDPAFTAEWPQ